MEKNSLGNIDPEDVEEDAVLVIGLCLRKEKFAFTRVRVDTREQFTDALDSFIPM